MVEDYQKRMGHFIESKSDSCIILANQLYEFSNLKGFPFGKVIAYETKGMYYEIVEGRYDKAGIEYLNALKVAEKEKLPYLAEVYHSLAVMYHTSDNYLKARKYYLEAYKYALKHKNRELQKKCLINLGSIHSSIHEYDKAESLFLRSLNIKELSDFNYDLYANLGNLNMRKKNYKKAVEFFEKASNRDSINYDSERNLRFLMDGKAALNDSTGMSSILERAKKSFESEVSSREKSLMANSISAYYQKFGFYKEALEFKNQYLKIYEELKEKQRDDIVYEVEAKFDSERKEEKLKRLQFEKEQQNKLYLVLFITGLILIGSTSFFLYKNRKKNKQLSNQKAILETTLNEKNILLKEVHHRVKNSFQIVSSLLFLQSQDVNHKEAKLAIKEAENRVRSMVLIHQKLYNKDEVIGIESVEYFSDLINDIFESYNTLPSKVKLNLDIERLVLDIDTITPLGLIFNELITNSIKHAFLSIQKEYSLRVSFKKNGDLLILEVHDNGEGFSGDINENSFGIKLMKALSKKIKAELKYDLTLNQGTKAILTIHKFKVLS